MGLWRVGPFRGFEISGATLKTHFRERSQQPATRPLTTRLVVHLIIIKTDKTSSTWTTVAGGSSVVAWSTASCRFIVGAVASRANLKEHYDEKSLQTARRIAMPVNHQKQLCDTIHTSFFRRLERMQEKTTYSLQTRIKSQPSTARLYPRQLLQASSSASSS